jgi:nucleoside-triphosphatase THEP1
LDLTASETLGALKMAITGSPGIGKSYFLFYLMTKLAQDPKTHTIIVHSRRDLGVTCFSGTQVLSGPINAFASQLGDRTTWYLVSENIHMLK